MCVYSRKKIFPVTENEVPGYEYRQHGETRVYSSLCVWRTYKGLNKQCSRFLAEYTTS
jgi:hypothetical protein